MGIGTGGFIVKRIKNDKGMTLIEIIVSLAILGIIVVSLSTVLSTGYIGIIKSGDKAEAAYKSQGEMTTKIQAEVSLRTQHLNINFSGGFSLPPIVVEIIESEEEINGSISTMTSFIPATP